MMFTYFNPFPIFRSEAFFLWIVFTILILVFVWVLLFVLSRIRYCKQLDKKDTWNIEDESKKIALEPYRVSQNFFNVIISNTCIITSFWIYCALSKIELLQNSLSNFLLLFLIIGAIFMNDILDKMLGQNMVSTKDIPEMESDKENLRLLSSLCVILIVSSARILHTTSTNGFLSSYIALVLGRFVFYDTLGKHLVDTYKKCAHPKYLVPLFLAFAVTCCIYGIGVYYSVITDSTSIDGLILTHVCMVLCIYFAKHIFPIVE